MLTKKLKNGIGNCLKSWINIEKIYKKYAFVSFQVSSKRGFKKIWEFVDFLMFSF